MPPAETDPAAVFATPPASGEYPPYYGRYAGLVPAGDVRETLAAQHAATDALLAGLSEADGDRRYAPGKWSVKEVVGHLADTERVFAYRMLAFLRGDATPLPSFEQDGYVAGGAFDGRTLASLRAEVAAVRAATLALVRSATAEQALRRGTASGGGFTARAYAWIIAGHERHHLAILRERYGL